MSKEQKTDFGPKKNLVRGEDGTFGIQFGLESAPKNPQEEREIVPENIIPFKSGSSEEERDDPWSDIGYIRRS